MGVKQVKVLPRGLIIWSQILLDLALITKLLTYNSSVAFIFIKELHDFLTNIEQLMCLKESNNSWKNEVRSLIEFNFKPKLIWVTSTYTHVNKIEM